MNKHKSNKIKENSNTVRHLIMGQIITTQNLVAIKVVRHAGQWESARKVHYCDVIMGAVASQITNLAIVYSSVSFSHRAKKTSKLRVTGLCVGNSPVTGEFHAQMASNAENVSLWWRHHETLQFLFWPHVCTFLFWMVYGTGALCDLWDKSIVAKWDALITLTSYAYRFISQATRLFNQKF